MIAPRLAVKPRVRGLAPWSPQAKTLALLDTIRSVLDEYAAYLPLTIRQIFYRLVGAHGYEKTELAYDRLGEIMARARRARMISFENIRDDSADLVTEIGYESGEAMVAMWREDARGFRLDRQIGQPQRLITIVEARGMKPQIETVAHPYSVPVIGSGGFDSLTWKYEMAERLGGRSVPTLILHIGDYDPSGVHIDASAADDIEAFIADLREEEVDYQATRYLPGDARFTRLAVTREQITALSLPTAPPKAKDKRAFEGNVTVQAEAIAPDIMAQIVEDAIRSRLDPDIYQQTLAKEAAIRERLIAQLGSLRLDD